MKLLVESNVQLDRINQYQDKRGQDYTEHLHHLRKLQRGFRCINSINKIIGLQEEQDFSNNNRKRD